MQTTLTITDATHIIEMIVRRRFPVAIKRMTKEKDIAIAIPEKAEVTKAFSLGIQIQANLEDCLSVFKPWGALAI